MVLIIDDSVKHPYYDPTLKIYVDSKKKRNKVMKERGLTFAGDYSKFCPPRKPIGKEHLPSREQIEKTIGMLKRAGGKLVK